MTSPKLPKMAPRSCEWASRVQSSQKKQKSRAKNEMQGKRERVTISGKRLPTKPHSVPTVLHNEEDSVSIRHQTASTLSESSLSLLSVFVCLPVCLKGNNKNNEVFRQTASLFGSPGDNAPATIKISCWQCPICSVWHTSRNEPVVIERTSHPQHNDMYHIMCISRCRFHFGTHRRAGFQAKKCSPHTVIVSATH